MKFYPNSAMEKVIIQFYIINIKIIIHLIFQLRKFYKFKAKHSKLFDDIVPASVRHVFEQELIRLLPKRDQNGVRILLIECGRKFLHS